MTTGNANNLNRNNEISLKDLILKFKELFKYLASKWLIIVFFGLIGGVLGFLYAYNHKPIYTAATTFVLEEEKPSGGLGSLTGLASMAGIDLGNGGGGIFQGDNILELYKSRTMIVNTLLTEIEYNGKKEILLNRYLETQKSNDSSSKQLFNKDKFSNLSTLNLSSRLSRMQDSVLTPIVYDISKNYLKVYKPDKTISIIKAETKSRDEFFAKTFNSQIVKNVNDFYVQTKTKKSWKNVSILQSKADSILAIMNGAINTSAATVDATPNLNPTRQIQRTVPMQRSQVKLETNKLILAEVVKNLELAKLALQKETPLIQVIDEPVFPLEKTAVGKIKGIIIGGILAGFIICFFLIVQRFFKLLLAD